MPEFDSTLEYRRCPIFPDYMIGNDGSVWTCLVRVGHHQGLRFVRGSTWAIMKSRPNNTGHRTIKLRGRCHVLVHKLVLVTFHGPQPKGTQARHFPDRDPANNQARNLSWTTPKQNQADRFVHGTECRGQSHPLAILDDDKVREIRSRYAKGDISSAALGKEYGVCGGTVLAIAKRRLWKHVTP